MKTTTSKLLLLLLMASCSRNGEQPYGPTVKPILIRPSIAARATDTAFEPGDEIGVRIITSDGETYTLNEKLSYSTSDGGFMANSLTWYSNKLKGDFVAYFPYQATMPAKFNVQSGQSVDQQFQASNLMYASKSNVEPSESGLSLQFDHMMARLVIDGRNDAGVSMSGVAIKDILSTADIDWETGSVSADENGERLSINPKRIAANQFMAYIVPQTTALCITYIWNDQTTEVNYPVHTFDSNHVYTVYVDIENDETFDKKIYSDGEINPWEDGGEIRAD